MLYSLTRKTGENSIHSEGQPMELLRFAKAATLKVPLLYPLYCIYTQSNCKHREKAQNKAAFSMHTHTSYANVLMN